MEYYFVVLIGAKQPDRDVLVDGQVDGTVGKVNGINRGTYAFSIDDPADFTPASQVVSIGTTTPQQPATVYFVQN